MNGPVKPRISKPNSLTYQKKQVNEQGKGIPKSDTRDRGCHTHVTTYAPIQARIYYGTSQPQDVPILHNHALSLHKQSEFTYMVLSDVDVISSTYNPLCTDQCKQATMGMYKRIHKSSNSGCFKMGAGVGGGERILDLGMGVN